MVQWFQVPRKYHFSYLLVSMWSLVSSIYQITMQKMTGVNLSAGLRGEDSFDKWRWNPPVLNFNECQFFESDYATPRKRWEQYISVRCWNNCMLEYSPFPFPSSHTKIHSPQSSNGIPVVEVLTQHLYCHHLRLGQSPVTNLICASPEFHSAYYCDLYYYLYHHNNNF